MYELLNKIFECIEFISISVSSDLAEISKTWIQCSQLYAGIIDKINVTWRAPVDTIFLEEFPDIRMKMAKKLERIENEQLSTMHLLIDRVMNIDKALKFKLDRIINIFEQVSFEKYDELKHSVREHIMWIENCWTCFHCLYMQLDSVMVSLQVLDLESANNLVEAIEQNKEYKLIIGKSQMYMQSCLSLLKYVENRSKIKINLS